MSVKGVMFIHNGVAFLNHIIDPTFEINTELTSGFLSAINSFASSVYGADVKSIDIGPHSIISAAVPLQRPGINKPEQFSIVMFADKGTGEKKVQEYLTGFKEAFLNLFSPEDVLGWDGNVLKFIPFKKIINKILNIHDTSSEASTVEFYNRGSDTDNEGIALILSTSVQKILDSWYTNIERPPIEGIMDRISADLSYNNTPTSGPNTSKIWEGIIPLLEQKQICYVIAKKYEVSSQLAKNINSQEPVYVIGCYFVGDKYQIFMGKLISQLHNRFSDIYAQLSGMGAGEWESISARLKEEMKEIKFVQKHLDEAKVDLKKFDPIELKDCDQALYALIVGKPIAIIGDNHQSVEACLKQALFFTPHRTMRIQEFPDTTLNADQVDVVVVTSKDKKHYGKDFVIMDLEKKQVKNGESNRFCEKLWKEVNVISDPYLVALFIKRKVNWLLSKATLIRDLSWLKEADIKAIKDIRADVEPDAEKIILKFAEGKNSSLQNLIDRLGEYFPPNKMLLDKNFVQFNEKKIIALSKITAAEMQGYIERLTKMGVMLLGPRVMDGLLN